MINPGFDMSLGNLPLLSKAKSRSISPENFTGEPGKGGMAVEGTGAQSARDLGQGWKISPFVRIEPGATFELADIRGPGMIQSIWMTGPGMGAAARNCILRVYWDDAEHPAVECPLGDFFACGWGKYAPVVSLPVCVNPGSGFNCYWPMPFRRRCRMTIENRFPESSEQPMSLYYQINYSLQEIPEQAAYFHARFRRVNPLPYKEVHTILDGVEGWGHYAGTYMCWGVNNNGWWGEGEIKFYIDDDHDFPTICGTGTEDYFCGSYNFENKVEKRYEAFNTPYAGLPQIIRPDGLYNSQTRFGMYRWHIMDPIRFEKKLRVTIQALGWRNDRRYLPLQDDIASTAYWYQTHPANPFPPLAAARRIGNHLSACDTFDPRGAAGRRSDARRNPGSMKSGCGRVTRRSPVSAARETGWSGMRPEHPPPWRKLNVRLSGADRSGTPGRRECDMV